MNLKQFRSVLLVYRPKNKKVYYLACRLAEQLAEKKIQVYTHPKRKLSLKKGAKVPIFCSNHKVDLGIVLGGDGTYLEAVRLLNRSKTPLLGINVGSLGFLTEVLVKNEGFSLDDLINEEFEIQERELLEIRVKEKNKTLLLKEALNDVVMERGERSRLLYLEIQYGGRYVGSVKSDGLIVATPTGSTAYNLSAGGPIVHSDLKAFILTPICPHSLSFRPMLFNNSQALKLNLHKEHSTVRASLSLDGQKVLNISPSHSLLIQNSKCKHYTLKLKSYDYFKILSEKLKFSE